jgi:hypothetical protein
MGMDVHRKCLIPQSGDAKSAKDRPCDLLWVVVTFGGRTDPDHTFSFRYLRLVLPKPPPLLARRLFWDVNFEKLDYEVDSALIIERVFSWGDIPDLRALRQFYGDSRIVEVLLISDYVPIVPLHLAAAIFNREVSDFKGAAKADGRDPSEVKREYFVRSHEIHGLPPFPESDPILMRMS